MPILINFIILDLMVCFLNIYFIKINIETLIYIIDYTVGLNFENTFSKKLFSAFVLLCPIVNIMFFILTYVMISNPDKIIEEYKQAKDRDNDRSE